MESYIQDLVRRFKNNADPHKAILMKAYMKNRFDFFGITSPNRKELSKPYLLKSNLPPIQDVWPVIHHLWSLPERELQYFSLDLLRKYNRYIQREWINEYEQLIINKSWWDTVDFIAANQVGPYFKLFPMQIKAITGRWMDAGNIWLQRSCILFQLKYGVITNTQYLSGFIEKLKGEKEFFIAKAIGWALRQYSKSNPAWVKDFVLNHELQPLSKREALKGISK